MTNQRGNGSVPQYVTELRAADVLFGRGSGPNDHEGNIRFRHLVAERKSEYMATNHRMTKAKIAKEIVDMVVNDNGRFLKKMEPAESKKLGFPDGVDAYEVADANTTMEKAKQALRQNTQKLKDAPDTVQAPSPGPEARRRHDDKSHPGYGNLEPLPIAPGFVGSSKPSRQAMPNSMNPPPPGWSGDNGHARSVPSTIVSPRSPNHLDESLNFIPDRLAVGDGTQGGTIDPNYSMAEIPSVEPSMDGRHASMTMGELSAVHSARRDLEDMDDVTDSFSKMKTADEIHKRFYSSQETMGTIEPIGENSLADMSLGSSTFSLMTKGNDSLVAGSFRDSMVGSFSVKGNESSFGASIFTKTAGESFLKDPGSTRGNESSAGMMSGYFKGGNESSGIGTFIRAQESGSMARANDSMAVLPDDHKVMRAPMQSSVDSFNTGGDSSMRFTDVFRRTSTHTINGRSHPRGSQSTGSSDAPSSLDLDGMGQSSMSVLRSVLENSNDVIPPGSNPHVAGRYGDSNSHQQANFYDEDSARRFL